MYLLQSCGPPTSQRYTSSVPNAHMLTGPQQRKSGWHLLAKRMKTTGNLPRSLAKADKVTVSKGPTYPSSHFAFVQVVDTYWFRPEGPDLAHPPPKDNGLCLWPSLLHRAYGSRPSQCPLLLTCPGKPDLNPELWCPGLLTDLLL